MGVYAAGNTYGVPEDLIYSFPVEIKVSPSNRMPVRGDGGGGHRVHQTRWMFDKKRPGNTCRG